MIAGMLALRYVARIALVAVACAAATVWLGWMSVPLVGFAFGLFGRRARARGTVAALGAALGWAAILAADAARGADARAVAERVGGVFQLPGIAFIALTLVFAALLSGPAAVIGAAVVPGPRGSAPRCEKDKHGR